jgi:lipoprotein-anchoring transpeptidase ErfK/SrfK
MRIRSGPGSDYSTVRRAPKGAVVKVLGGPYGDSYYKVRYRGTTGYARKRYLRHTGLAGKGIAQGYSKVIVVSRSRQQLEAYQNGNLVLVTAVTTGRPQKPTPLGSFRIRNKKNPARFTSPYPKGSPYYYETFYARYSMNFRHGGYAIHHAPRRPYYGYGTNVYHQDPDGAYRRGSLGCVNTPLWAMSRLYGFSHLGMRVRIVN